MDSGNCWSLSGIKRETNYRTWDVLFGVEWRRLVVVMFFLTTSVSGTFVLFSFPPERTGRDKVCKNGP